MPVLSKSEVDTRVALRDFVGNRHGRCPGTVHSDRAKEIIAAVDGLRRANIYDWVHSRATPHRESSRGAIENEIKVVLGMTRCSLNKIGFPLCWWPRAVRHQCFCF